MEVSFPAIITNSVHVPGIVSTYDQRLMYESSLLVISSQFVGLLVWQVLF